MSVMKRWISVLLVVALALGCVSAAAESAEAAQAPEETEEVTLWDSLLDRIGGMLDSTGDRLGEAWGGVSRFADNARKRLGTAVGRAKQAIGNAWASTGEVVKGAWSWIATFVSETSDDILSKVHYNADNLKAWLDISGAGALDKLRGVFDSVAATCGLASDKAAALWESMQQYAEEHNIDMVVLVKLALAIMVRVSLGRYSTAVAKIADKYMRDEIRVIMDWFPYFGINSEKAAEDALGLLHKALAIE